MDPAGMAARVVSTDVSSRGQDEEERGEKGKDDLLL